MFTPPSIAILVPVHQNQGGLELSLDSILAAELPSRVVTIVVDDGSQPPVNFGEGRYKQIGLVVYRLERNQGIEAALNIGLLEALRPGVGYLARLDAGDRMLPDRLKIQYDFLQHHPEVVIVGSEVEFVDGAGKKLFVYQPPVSDKAIRRRMHISSSLLHPAVMMRVSAIKSVGNYRAEYPAAEDYDFFFRLLSIGSAASIAKILTVTTIDENGISVGRRREQLISRLRIQLKYFDPLIIESYIGILATLLFLGLPSSLVGWLKQRMGRVPC